MPSPNSAFPATTRWPSWFMGPLSSNVLEHKWRCSFFLLTGLPSSFIVKEWSCAPWWKKWWSHPYITQPFSVNFVFQINFLLHPFFYCAKNLEYIVIYWEEKVNGCSWGRCTLHLCLPTWNIVNGRSSQNESMTNIMNRHCLVKNLDISVFISLLWNHEQLQYNLP